jgi:hypothetical protein
VSLPKYTHIAKPTRRPVFGPRVALCGRMVDLLGIESPERATCTKCVAEHLTRSRDLPLT